jgi:hypothetical protein
MGECNNLVNSWTTNDPFLASTLRGTEILKDTRPRKTVKAWKPKKM